jgi:hypothetical protein
LINPKVFPLSRRGSAVEKSEVVGMLQEMKDRLVADFGFAAANLVGEAHLNRTTEPLARFLLWLDSTPEAQTALQLALQRLVGKPRRR